MFDLPQVTVEDNSTEYDIQDPVPMPPTQPQEPVNQVTEEVTNEVPPVEVSEEKKTEEVPVSPEPVESHVEIPVEALPVPEVDLSVPVQPTGPDGSFNCSNCLGAGLVVNTSFPQGKICERCGGTGKI